MYVRSNLSFLFSNLFSQPKQCVQQVVDAETLLKVVSKIVEDIPNICLSKFKVIYFKEYWQLFGSRSIRLGLLHGPGNTFSNNFSLF